MSRTVKRVITLVTILLVTAIIACGTRSEETAPAPETEEVTSVPASEEATTTPAPDEVAPAVAWGIIEIRVTDPPPVDVASAVVYLTDIEVHRVSDNTGEWILIIGVPPSFDLLDVIAVEAVLGSANITAGSFTQIRLKVDRVAVVTVAGDSVNAQVPGGRLKIIGPFNIAPGLKTILTLDFDGEKSLILAGKGKALFKPVVKLLKKQEKPGGEEKQAEESAIEEIEVELEEE